MTSIKAPTQQQQASPAATPSASSSRGQDHPAELSTVLQSRGNHIDPYSTSQLNCCNGVPSEAGNRGGYSGLTQPGFSSQTYVDGNVYSDEELLDIVMECVSDREKLAAVAAAISFAPYPKPSLPVPQSTVFTKVEESDFTLAAPQTAESGLSIPYQRFIPNGLPPSCEDTMQRDSARAKHAEQQDKTKTKGKRSRKGDGNKRSKRLKTEQQSALNGHPLSTNAIIQGNIAHRDYAGATSSGLQYRNLQRMPPSSPLSIPTQLGPSPWIPIGSSQTPGLQHETCYAYQNSPALLGHRSLPLQEQIVPVPFQRRIPAPVSTPSPTRNTPLAPLQISQFTPSELLHLTPFPTSHHSPGSSRRFHPPWM